MYNIVNKFKQIFLLKFGQNDIPSCSKTNNNDTNHNINNNRDNFNFLFYIKKMIFLGFFGYIVFTHFSHNSIETISWTFLSSNIFNNEIITKIMVLDDTNANIYVNDSTKYTMKIPDYRYLETKMVNYTHLNIPIYYKKSFNIMSIISMIFNLYMLYSVYRMFVGGLGNIIAPDSSIMSLQNGSNTNKNPDNNNVTLDDVIGMDDNKQQVLELTDVLINRDKYLKMGVKTPKGILMIGPPGTGKTLLAKAVAGTRKINFIYTPATSFNEIFVGLGSKKIKSLFENARKYKPTIIFIDELDAIGKKRSGRHAMSHQDRDNTLNQLLVEMDGFATEDGVLVIAATNIAGVLDKALLRPGRFDRKVYFELPISEERIELSKYYIKKMPFDGDLIEMSEKLAKLTRGCSPAEIANITNEAALHAVRNDCDKVTFEHIEYAVDYVTIGRIKVKKDKNNNELERVAFHEVGHALVSFIKENEHFPNKLTIVPRQGGIMGFSQSIGKEDKNIYTKNDLEAKMMVLLGGRCAEKIKYGDPNCDDSNGNDLSTGAHDDLEKLNDIAYKYVTKYGMSAKMGAKTVNNNDFPYKLGSDYYSKLIDDETRTLIQNLETDTIKLLNDNFDVVTELAELLLEKETIYYKDIKSAYDKKIINNVAHELITTVVENAIEQTGSNTE